jgi:hypothetical protein
MTKGIRASATYTPAEGVVCQPLFPNSLETARFTGAAASALDI